MRGRLTLEKVNAAINDMATYAEANTQLISAPKKKVMIKLSILIIILQPSSLQLYFPFYLSP